MWRDGPVVGELVVVGAAKGDGSSAASRTSCARACAVPSARARGTGCSPVPPARRRARATAQFRPSRSRSPRCPACACPGGRAARSPTARWPRAGCWPTTGAWRPAAARRSTRIVRKAFALSVEGRPAGAQLNAVRDQAIAFAGQQAGVQLTLPVTIVRNYPSTGSGAATLGVDADGSYRSAKPAARCIISVRRGGASRTVIAAQVFHCLQIQLAGRANACGPSMPTAPWLGEGSAAYAGCLFAQDGARPTARHTRRTSSEPRPRWTTAPTTPSASSPTWSRAARRARGVPQALARVVAGAAAYPASGEGAAGPVRRVGLEPVPHALARRAMGRQRPVRAAAVRGRPAHADRPRRRSGAITLAAPAYAAHPFELFAGHSAPTRSGCTRVSGHVRVGSAGLDDAAHGRRRLLPGAAPRRGQPGRSRSPAARRRQGRR